MSLVIEDLEITLGGQLLVGLPRCDVAPGEVVTVMGPSGSGKSTLLAWLSGALDPAFRARGRLLLDGNDVSLLPPARRRIGLLFQDDLLFPHLSVAENLAFGLFHGCSTIFDEPVHITAAAHDEAAVKSVRLTLARAS